MEILKTFAPLLLAVLSLASCVTVPAYNPDNYRDVLTHSDSSASLPWSETSISAKPRSHPAMSYVEVGDTRDHLLTVMGPPASTAGNPLSDAEVWAYGPQGRSTIHLIKGRVADWQDGDGVLKLKEKRSTKSAQIASETSKAVLQVHDATTSEESPSASSASSSGSGGTVSVSGYTRRDGTYVQPYVRAAPSQGNRR